MKQYVYPVVLYYNDADENYIVAFDDLEMYTEGNTVEEAFLSAKQYLECYLSCNLKMNFDINEATSYLDLKDKHKEEIVLLVDADLKRIDIEI